jgi:hypothetical protein
MRLSTYLASPRARRSRFSRRNIVLILYLIHDYSDSPEDTRERGSDKTREPMADLFTNSLSERGSKNHIPKMISLQSRTKSHVQDS